MGVHIMKYRATGDCRTPNYKVLGSVAAYDHATAELNLGARSLCIGGGYSGWDWVSIILVGHQRHALQRAAHMFVIAPVRGLQ